MNMSFIIMEGKYGAIDADYSSYHGYYIINFSSSPYNLQEDLNIDGQVISSGEMVWWMNLYLSNQYQLSLLSF